jgi:ubiquinone/menaquinone biosynthesis C-methylase UbiE
MTTVSDYFKDHAPKYDSFTLRAMPRYEEMLGEIVRCLPGQANDILELGCGQAHSQPCLRGTTQTARLRRSTRRRK